MDLAELTTLRLGGPARAVVEATTEAELVDAVRVADEAGEPVLLVGGGSNLVVADAGFDGTVVLRPDPRHRRSSADACSGAMVTVAAGESWDDFVAHAVAQDWDGVEALSGIPGSVGATPIQNVGAYGQEVAETIVSVRTWDRAREARPHARCSPTAASRYRHSRFKAEPDRFVVLTVTFQLALRRRPQRARALRRAGPAPRRRGRGAGARLPQVRETVLALRRGKGMVLDADDHDTWSAGSFFTNPILTPDEAAALPPEAPALRAARRHGQDQRGVADRPRRLRARATARGPWPCPASTCWPSRTAAAARRPSCSTSRARCATACEREFGIRLVNEPVLVGDDLL